jgi:glycosyltransferase involved in cell wall biosynthesis
MPIAANIDDSTWPLPPESAVDDYTQDLVFFGTSWHRKGGDFLLQVTRELDARGHPGRLLVVGPPASEVMQRATNYGIAHKVRPLGPLDKSSTESLRRVRDAVRRAALHLLPTVADCSPVSIPELAALAIPTIGRAVGGVAYTCEAAGGLSLNPAATVTDWCDAVTRLTDSPMELSRRRGQSLAQYWRGLRWSRVIERIVRLE